jgi:hypothetical protein
MSPFFISTIQPRDFLNFLDALSLRTRFIDYVHVVALKTIQLNFLLEDGQFTWFACEVHNCSHC